jgi:CIC family chloride channel protein
MAEHTFLVSAAVVIGIFGGLGAVLFRLLIKGAQRVSWGEWSFSLDLARAHPWWWVALAPAVGGLVVGPMVYFLAREAKGHGVPEVMEAVALRGGVLRPRVVVVKSLASAVCIGTGGSVGREGPIVQIGSALGSTLGQLLRLSGRRLRTLVGCGAAAGIAATFNAPIAGALFAVEIILGDFGVSQFSPIVISSVLATVVSRHYLGNFPAFQVPEYQLVSPWELPLYALLGLVAAGVALAFIRFLYGLEDLFEAVPLPPWTLAPIGGLMVGALGITYPQVFGVGYEAIEAALRNETAVGLMLMLLVLKLVATSVTIGSGGSGGVFAPSLFIGAMAGGAVGALANQVMPELTASPGAYALVGMGAVVAGATHAPLTAIVIIFELTSDYKLIVPLMMACIISTLVTTRVQRESIYTMKLIRRGIDLAHGRDFNILRSLQVAEVMEEPEVTVQADAPLGEVIKDLAANPRAVAYVVDSEGRLRGFIVPAEMRQVLEDVDEHPLLLAADLAREDVSSLTPELKLDVVMRIFGGKERDELPVVAGDGSGRLVGVVARRHLISAYNRELMKRDMVSGVHGSLAGTATGEVHLGEDYRMAEIDAPTAFFDRSIRDLDVRAAHGAQILLLRPAGGGADSPEIVPEPDTVVRPGDRLVVVARRHELDRLRAL